MSSEATRNTGGHTTISALDEIIDIKAITLAELVNARSKHHHNSRLWQRVANCSQLSQGGKNLLRQRRRATKLELLMQQFVSSILLLKHYCKVKHVY